MLTEVLEIITNFPGAVGEGAGSAGAVTVLVAVAVVLLGTTVYAWRMIRKNRDARRREAVFRTKLEKELARIQEITQTGNWVWELTSNELRWSDEVYRIFGLEPRQFGATYEAFLDRVHPQDREYVEEAVQRALHKREAYDIHHRVVRPNGEIRVVRERGNVFFDDDGKPVQMIGTVQDVTVLKEKEDLTARFGRILDNSFNEIYVFNEETLKFTQVNQGALKNLGYTLEEMQALTPLDLKPEFNPDQFEKFVEPLRNGTETLKVFETIHRRKDGTDYPVEIRLQLSQQETPPQFVAIAQNISERNEARAAMERAMQALETRVQERTAALLDLTRRNELILSSAAEGICGLDAEGAITFANPAATNILGYVSDEMVGKTLHDLVHHSREDGTPYPLEECPSHASLQRGDPGFESEEVFWRKDGSALWVEYTSTPIREGGKIVGAVVTFRDITERREAERKLVKSESMFRAILNNTFQMIGLLTPKGSVIEVNKAALEMGGVLREAVVGKPLWEGPWWRDSRQVQDLIRDAVTRAAEGQFVRFETQHVDAEMKVRCIDFSMTPIRDAEGNVVWLVPEGRDITRIKNMQLELLRAKEDAEAANKSKSLFLSQMSHELRNPLNAILGFGQLLELDTKHPLTETQKLRLNWILQGSEHLLNLINEILDLSRIEAGNMRMKISRFPLSDVVAEVISLTKSLADTRKVNVCHQISTGQEVYAQADPVRLRQVLINLVTNGIKYNRPAGMVKIECEPISDNFLSIKITDTGHGIPPEKMGDLFKPFERLGKERSNIEGTGIGLALSQRLMEKMNGSVSCESEPGVGSCFTVICPRGKPPFDEPARILRSGGGATAARKN